MMLKSSINVSSLIFLSMVVCLMASQHVMRNYVNKDSFGAPKGYRIVIYTKKTDKAIKDGRIEAKKIPTIKHKREYYQHIYELPGDDERFVLTLDDGACDSFLLNYGTIAIENPQDKNSNNDEDQHSWSKQILRPEMYTADHIVF